MAYTEALHKRGTGAQGGQFVTKGAGGQTQTTSQIGYDGKGRGTGYGAKGGDPNVQALQKQLNRLGIVDAQGNQLKVDGKFGPKTTAAVRRLQQRLGLTVDGKVTPELLAKLKKMTPSRHDQHVMHVRHQAAQKAKGAAAPVKKATPAKRKPRAGLGSKPKTGMGFNSRSQKPSQSARDAAARKNSVTRSVSYSTGMTDVERHFPGRHNQQSHANRVGRILASSKGLGKDFKKAGKIKPGETPSAKILRDVLVGEDAGPFVSASRRIEDHQKILEDAGASPEQARKILQDLGVNPDQGYQTHDFGYGLSWKVQQEEAQAKLDEFTKRLAAATPAAYARLLGTDGRPALVKSKPVQKVFEAAQRAGWMVTSATGHGGYTFSSPDGSKVLQILTINGVTLYDERHNKISGVKALALVEGT